MTIEEDLAEAKRFRISGQRSIRPTPVRANGATLSGVGRMRCASKRRFKTDYLNRLFDLAFAG